MRFKPIFCLALTLLCGVSQADNQNTDKQKSAEEVYRLVQSYCGACHGVPSPTLMPKEDWPSAVKVMADIAKDRLGYELISAEHVRDIAAYYYGSSPEMLGKLPVFPETKAPIAYSMQAFATQSKMPLITDIRVVQLYKSKFPQILLSDAENGKVSLLERKKANWQETTLLETDIPSTLEIVDYDQDGDQDILIAVLGRFFPPINLQAGKVILLEQVKKGKFKQHVLLENVPRVQDVKAADIDADGDLDLALAIYGNNQFGELAWLENLGKGKHQKHTLLDVSGGVNLIPTDINLDGKLDFISLISQEHEMVLALVNRGNNKFESINLFQASDPMIGSIDLSLADLDGDGDLDILFANGDAHDLQTDPKPYHGVQWLENLGRYQYQFHNLARFYGASKALARDLDGDGDLDVVASSWNNYWNEEGRQTLIWFENVGDKHFQAHRMLGEPESIVAFDIADIDNDGRVEIVAGIFKIDLLKRYWEKKVENEKAGAQILVDEPLKIRTLILDATPQR